MNTYSGGGGGAGGSEGGYADFTDGQGWLAVLYN